MLDMSNQRKDLVELQRSRFQDEIDEVCGILDENEIPYKLGTDGAVYDLSQIGVGGDPQTIISVPGFLFNDAREAMEKHFIQTPLPEDHYLHSFSDDEFIDLLATESDWSAYDVAHARKIMEEQDISYEKVAASKEQLEEALAYGKPAPKWMMWVPIIMSIFWILTSPIGVVGLFIFLLIPLGISWSVLSMKAKHPHSQYFLYDLKSRESAKILFYLNIILCFIAIILLFSIYSHM